MKRSIEEENFLTEKKLGVILKEIFPNSEIIPQFVHYGRKIDYGIIVDYLDEGKGPQEFYDECDCDDESEDREHDCVFNNKTLLLVEYDGYHHYNTVSQVVRDRKGQEDPVGVNWSATGDQGVFKLRIPYWIQLDLEMTRLLFKTDRDFSNGFPQGFISKLVVLPERFSSEGERRFIYEMNQLPVNVAKKVYDSLIVKLNQKSIERVASLYVWKNLVEAFDKSRSSQIKKMLLTKDVLVTSLQQGRYLRPENIESQFNHFHSLAKLWYQEYKADGGSHSYDTFVENVRQFNNIIDIDDSDGSFKKWTKYIGSLEEARRYFQAVDGITPVS